MDCPVCGKKVRTDYLKSWKYGEFEVKRYRCSECESAFNFYTGKGITFYVPKPQEE